MAGHRRIRCSGRSSGNWHLLQSRSRRTLRMRWRWLYATSMSRNSKLLQRARNIHSSVTMITRISGILNRVLEDEVRLQVGPLEYQVLVPEFVRRNIQGQVGQELKLHTSEYLEGNPMQGRVVP